MRTTLDIDEDVLQAAKEIARREKKTTGQVISTLARRALTAPRRRQTPREPRAAYGFRPVAPRGPIVSNELIDELRDDDAY